jgi:hypothetical protein
MLTTLRYTHLVQYRQSLSNFPSDSVALNSSQRPASSLPTQPLLNNPPPASTFYSLYGVSTSTRTEGAPRTTSSAWGSAQPKSLVTMFQVSAACATYLAALLLLVPRSSPSTTCIAMAFSVAPFPAIIRHSTDLQLYTHVIIAWSGLSCIHYHHPHPLLRYNRYYIPSVPQQMARLVPPPPPPLPSSSFHFLY